MSDWLGHSYATPLPYHAGGNMTEIDPEATRELRDALTHAQRATYKSQVFMKTASAWAYWITAEIVDSIETGITSSRGDRCPMDVPGFAELQDWCDANMYLIDAIPGIAIWDTEEECARVTAFANLITDEITRLLSERADHLHIMGITADNWPGEDS